MRRSLASRSVAVFMATLLAFQLGLTGSGVFCLMPGLARGEMTRSMSGAMAMGNSTATTSGPVARAAAAQTPEQMPCDQQMSPLMCQAMGPCIMALAAAAVSADHSPFIVHSRRIAMSVVAPPSRTLAPEPPPPRA